MNNQNDILNKLYSLSIELKKKYGRNEFLLQSNFVDPDMKTTLGFTFEDISKIEEEVIDEFFKPHNICVQYFYEYHSAFGDEIDHQISISFGEDVDNPLNIWILRNGEISLGS